MRFHLSPVTAARGPRSLGRDGQDTRQGSALGQQLQVVVLGMLDAQLAATVLKRGSASSNAPRPCPTQGLAAMARSVSRHKAQTIAT